MKDLIPPSVLAALDCPPDTAVRPLGAGHIHGTWLVERPAGRAVLQRLNDAVFPEPEHVVDNAVAVAGHLVRRRAAGDYPLEIARPIVARDGALAVRDPDGKVWRAMQYVEATRTVDVVDSPAEARTAAGAFGAFDAAMADFDATRLHVVIPNFHDLRRRMRALETAARSDRAGRAWAARAELSFCRDQQALVDEVADLESRLPRRACHNDTKIDNLLFDAASDTARAVIDLDTCMPGFWMHDYGDMVRTFCSPEPEDSTRLERVRVREDVFAALTEGYLAAVATRLEPVERRSLWAGASTMPFMVAVRFLTDWLEGDRYFATRRPDHNLDRARNQLALYRDLSGRREELVRLVEQP